MDVMPPVDQFRIPEALLALLFCTLIVHAGQSQWPILMEQGDDWLIAALELG
jgi:hypothetical protein